MARPWQATRASGQRGEGIAGSVLLPADDANRLRELVRSLAVGSATYGSFHKPGVVNEIDAMLFDGELTFGDPHLASEPLNGPPAFCGVTSVDEYRALLDTHRG